MEFFYCLWRHERAQYEYEALSRNWIGLDKFTSDVMIIFDTSESQGSKKYKE